MLFVILALALIALGVLLSFKVSNDTDPLRDYNEKFRDKITNTP